MFGVGGARLGFDRAVPAGATRTYTQRHEGDFDGDVFVDSPNETRVTDSYNENTNTFTVAASASDPESGVDSTTWAFPPVTGFTETDTNGTATYTGNNSAAAGTAGTYNVTVKNRAGLQSLGGSGFALVQDATPPAGGGMIAPAYSSNGNATLNVTQFTDSGAGDSGIATQTLERWKAPFSILS